LPSGALAGTAALLTRAGGHSAVLITGAVPGTALKATGAVARTALVVTGALPGTALAPTRAFPGTGVKATGAFRGTGLKATGAFAPTALAATLPLAVTSLVPTVLFAGTELWVTAGFSRSDSLSPTALLGGWEPDGAAAGGGFFEGVGLWAAVGIGVAAIALVFVLFLLFKKRKETTVPLDDAPTTDLDDIDATYVSDHGADGDYVNPLIDDDGGFGDGFSSGSFASEGDEVL
jgi:hypothetical protein